jgi:hypothetical protein
MDSKLNKEYYKPDIRYEVIEITTLHQVFYCKSKGQAIETLTEYIKQVEIVSFDFLIYCLCV